MPGVGHYMRGSTGSTTHRTTGWLPTPTQNRIDGEVAPFALEDFVLDEVRFEAHSQPQAEGDGCLVFGPKLGLHSVRTNL